jgi:glycosyltransferase involved in cell wall biosynthesis
LPEVCADAALYVDPYDTQSIASAMKAMLTDPWLRQLMIVKGVERAKQFRWEDSARKHVEVFQHALAAREDVVEPHPAFSFPSV